MFKYGLVYDLFLQGLLVIIIDYFYKTIIDKLLR